MAFLPALLSAGTAAYGLFGNNGGPNNNQKQANNLLNSSATQSIGNYGNLYNAGMGYLGNAQQDFQAPTSYYSSILSGNPASVAGAIGPESNQLSAGYTNARRQLDQFGPMGGGRSTQMAQLPFQQQGAITNLISQARQGAAQGLTGIAGAQGALGLDTLGAGNQGLGIGTQAAGALNNNAYNQNVMQYGAGQGIGSSIAQMLINSKLGGLFGGGGSGGGGSSPWGSLSTSDGGS